MKQPFILTLVSSVACAATAANKAPENTTPTKSKTPNVVFIYADDLGYGDLECYCLWDCRPYNGNYARFI